MHFEPGFLVSIVLILIVSRLFGEIAQRLGQPSVIGELIAGLVLGPSLFGLLFPAAEHLVFPPAPEKKAMLQAFAEYGVLLLLVLTGMEVDLPLLRRIARQQPASRQRAWLFPLRADLRWGCLRPIRSFPIVAIG